MARIMISPSKFILGRGEMKNLGKHIAAFGKKAVIVSHPDDFNRQKEALEGAFDTIEVINPGFGGECSSNEIARLEKVVLDAKADVVVGIGGGKSLDTAKAVAFKTKKPVIVVPTIASTDAPTSALAVIYTESGEFQEYMFFTHNPDLVLVDSDVIAKAPVRFLISGMGDALATWFEARACERSDANNMSGGKSTKAALTLAKVCYDTLLEDGFKAVAACEAKVVTKSLENIIEACILLSGLGFESSGLAGAHSIHDGLTVLEETHSVYHGEKVAFGTIVQLVLENVPQSELTTVIEFCKKLNLPTCLKDLGVTDLSDERLMQVAMAACDPDNNMKNMPFAVTPEDLCAAIRAADKIGGAL
ncbi:MAG TPA: glycerol dehydrogenase [Epulopiscium sp.]|nr:glycerol dehydrogenase [Candidatus Epulonipiscium sp.]